ncbi:hypothetical protein [Ferruginibacter albus]|uniref:hypothetical protein n=1 Tax=Ferruginibacter albus TaxID=2875540 RepID=UPI001CC430E1|nr:hypothetical protein [Ferruginibacter albus]UAY50817.1 hypothetical protein K9M53_09460 [Ferruginibacter albus]
MKFLPFENYTITTTLSQQEILKRIADNIEPKRSYRFTFFRPKANVAYEGKIVQNTFSINRIIYYRNSFIPLIKGNVTAFSDHTEVHIKMQLRYFTLLFVAIWLGFTGMICSSIISFISMDTYAIFKGKIPSILILPFGMFILGYLITILNFTIESKRSKKFLARLLEAGEE